MDSPHSSKKVRVCKPCFDHQQNLGSSLLSSSMLDNESDEDEEEEQDKTRENRAGVISSSSNQTDEGKIKQRPVESSEVPLTEDEPSIYDDINHEDTAGITGNDNEDDIDEAMFQIVSQEEVLRSINEYTHPKLPAAVPQNMTSSMLLYADELEAGQVNRQNEVIPPKGSHFLILHHPKNVFGMI
ncbi:uncharacterized protein LOC131956912 [Physella acuta]|uniref:uncharacterized protein LOC131956912 n=1 Tax=Physella acuta TaxID=109671 RepID=UPI0027DCC465|nr:uncharacterized protein LOC131956912 [Physella acuta]